MTQHAQKPLLIEDEEKQIHSNPSSIHHQGDESDADFKRQMITNRPKAVLLMLISNVFFIGYASLSKYLMNYQMVMINDIMLARAFACLLFSLLVAMSSGTSLYVAPGQRFWLTVRSFLGSFAFMFYQAAVQLIPLVLVQVIDGLAPFWAILIAWIMLGSRFSPLEWFTLIVSFGAIALIYFSAQGHGEEQKVSKKDMIFGCGFALITSACLGFLSVLNRVLTGISFSVQLFYAGSVATIIALICLFSDHILNESPLMTLSYSLTQYVLIALAMSCNFAGLSCFVVACQNDNPALLQILNYSGLVYAFLIDQFVFELPLQGPLQVVAIVILVSMNLLLIWNTLYNKK